MRSSPRDEREAWETFSEQLSLERYMFDRDLRWRLAEAGASAPPASR